VRAGERTGWGLAGLAARLPALAARAPPPAPDPAAAAAASVWLAGRRPALRDALAGLQARRPLSGRNRCWCGRRHP